jgi:hypothetical protein
LNIIFGHQEQNKINDRFAVFDNYYNNCGKIYLPLTVSLEPFIKVKDNLGFDVQIKVRETKIVLYY